MSQPSHCLDNLAERHPGLTAAIATYFHEAARVCLSRHHSPPTEFSYRDETGKAVMRVDWVPPDERTLQAWANEIDTTEAGAYACALASVERVKGLVAIHRAQTETGADYYLAPAGKTLADLEECFRLEVSGTDLLRREVQRRLRQKVKQALAANHPLPAIAIVVGFRTLLVLARNAE
jgi:hypothetical protein